MCGDICCPSCGPVQGNSCCPICGQWVSEGCKHVDEKTCELKQEFQAEADAIVKMAKNRINTFFHCKRCLTSIPDGLSPREWIRMEVGWTKEGIQVWCVRHEINVADIDFKGQKVAFI